MVYKNMDKKEPALCLKTYNPYTFCPLVFKHEDDMILSYISMLSEDIKRLQDDPLEEAKRIDRTCMTITAYMNGRVHELIQRIEKSSRSDHNKVDRPVVVCLCGSTRFKEAFESAMRSETLNGKIVLTVGLFGHLEGLDMEGSDKVMLDQLHFRKIDLADEILVLNVGGYIGSSTRNEINYAFKTKKLVRYLETPIFNGVSLPLCGDPDPLVAICDNSLPHRTEK